MPGPFSNPFFGTGLWNATRAPNTVNYDTPDEIPLDVQARHILFDVETVFNRGTLLGIAEIQLFAHSIPAGSQQDTPLPDTPAVAGIVEFINPDTTQIHRHEQIINDFFHSEDNPEAPPLEVFQTVDAGQWYRADLGADTTGYLMEATTGVMRKMEETVETATSFMITGIDATNSPPFFPIWLALDEAAIRISALGGSSESLDGDYDQSGTVELNDLDLVLFHWSADRSGLPAIWVNQRPAGGTTVGLDQLNGVLFNWGRSALVASVPEPSSWLLVGMALLVFVRHGAGSEIQKRDSGLKR